ncbi:hypothetical protein CI109_102674 [Kwoniella shandongensis]|uniref:Uncharacterized protein n=1 Tax=Kwoniella shandongensis TaxID=1734106 RepID=A0AAJ8LJH3_9TREE
MRLTAPPRTTSLVSLLVLPVPLAALVLAYLWTVSKRPNIPDYAQVEDPHQWGFPRWYGQGLSPYDYGIKLDGEEEDKCDDPKKVLLFIDDSLEMPHAITTLKSLQSDPSINISLISPFSPDWNSSQSASDNLVDAGCDKVDWIWRIGGFTGDIAAETCGKAVWVQEDWNQRAGITLLDRPHDLLKSLMDQEHEEGEAQRRLVSHVLPAAELVVGYHHDFNIFYPSRRGSSQDTLTYFPNTDTSPRDYPSLPWGRTWSIHSPSKKAPPKTKPEEDPFAPQSAYRRYWAKSQEKRAAAMRHAGICLFEGWQDGVVDEWVAQAMLSGCVVAMVPPHAEHDMFGSLILPLPRPTLSDPTLPLPLPVDTLNAVLRHTPSSELKQKALQAFIASRHHLHPRARVKAVQEVVKKWDLGGRGYDFPHGYRWDCDSVIKPTWCG